MGSKDPTSAPAVDPPIAAARSSRRRISVSVGASLAARGFYSFQAWSAAAAAGAALLWRAPTGLRLSVVRVLADGTYVSVVINPKIRGGRRERIVAATRAGADLDPDQAHLVRVVEYDVPDRDGNGAGELIVLLTSILDPADARADELADTYHLRWEEETSNDQLKTITRAAEAADLDPDPDRISFTRAPRIARRTATGTAGIPPWGLD